LKAAKRRGNKQQIAYLKQQVDQADQAFKMARDEKKATGKAHSSVKRQMKYADKQSAQQGGGMGMGGGGGMGMSGGGGGGGMGMSGGGGGW